MCLMCFAFCLPFIWGILDTNTKLFHLQEVIVRQLLARLNSLGFGFHVPEAHQVDTLCLDFPP